MYAESAVQTLVIPVCYRTIPVTLVLKDPQLPDQDLGSLELAVTLTPKHSPLEERRDSTVRVLLITSLTSASVLLNWCECQLKIFSIMYLYIYICT